MVCTEELILKILPTMPKGENVSASIPVDRRNAVVLTSVEEIANTFMRRSSHTGDPFSQHQPNTLVSEEDVLCESPAAAFLRGNGHDGLVRSMCALVVQSPTGSHDDSHGQYSHIYEGSQRSSTMMAYAMRLGDFR